MAAASILVTLAGVELLARRFVPPPTRVMADFPLLASGYYERHPVVGWLPRKNVVGTQRRPGSFDASFRTNSRGLRDREYAFERTPGVGRIVVLGDSMTWGSGIDDGAVFTERVESLLRDVEVVNLGVAAFGTRQELDYLKIEGLRYQPDTVLLAFCLNDVYSQFDSADAKYEFVARRGPAMAPRSGSVLGAVKRWMAEWSVLYGLTRDAVNTNRFVVKWLVRLGLRDGLSGFDDLDSSLMPALRTYPQKLERAWAERRRELLEMRGLLAERGIRFVLAVVPSLQSVDDRAFRHSIAYSVFEPEDFDLQKPYRLLEEFAREHRIEFVNPWPAVKKREQAGERMFLRRDVHLNEGGHEALARAIVDHLSRSQ